MSNNWIELNNWREIPLMSLGTHKMQNAVDIVYNSIKDSIRLIIDTATRYWNEEEIGKDIKRELDEELCKREDLFIVAKIWLIDKPNPEKGLLESLKKLQLDYIDLYLDHRQSVKDYRTNQSDPFDFVSIDVFWPNMEPLVTMGLAKSIRVSNYNVQNLFNLLSICKIKLFANQVEFQPYLYQKNLKDFSIKEILLLFLIFL
jgi:aldehyde reductase